jgi:hypothetical protein
MRRRGRCYFKLPLEAELRALRAALVATVGEDGEAVAFHVGASPSRLRRAALVLLKTKGESMDLLRAHFETGESFLLTGPPGIGKTKRIEAAARASGRRFFAGIGGRTADLMDRLDVAGAIYPKPEAGISVLLPLGELSEILGCQDPAVWFVDEIGRALLEVQGGLCSVWDLLRDNNPQLMICGATNRPKDAAGVARVSSQVTSRFAAAYEIATPDAAAEVDADGRAVTTGTVLLQPWCCDDATTCDGCEVCGWVSWAYANGMPAELVGWHVWTKGRTLYTWKPHSDPAMRSGDFRTWAALGRAWVAGVRDLRSLAARVGKGNAGEFLGFASGAADLPAMTSIWSDPTGAKVPSEGNPGGLYLLAARLISGCTRVTAEATFQYVNRMPRIFGALVGRDLYRQKGALLEGVRAAAGWYVANQDLFKVGTN